jgi:hypothetical protein
LTADDEDGTDIALDHNRLTSKGLFIISGAPFAYASLQLFANDTNEAAPDLFPFR